MTVTKSLLEFFPDIDPFVEEGKAYVFHFKLSLDPVNFSVTVDGKKRDEVTDEITI